MCGIVAYVGKEMAEPILIDGLARLEYRGYDSAGLSLAGKNGIVTVKSQGRLQQLKERVGQLDSEDRFCGIAHTRWASHGKPSDANAHPHYTEKVSLVHNGIIENYLDLKNFAQNNNYDFLSETDTETVAKLLDYFYQGNPFSAIKKVIEKIEGSYALAILFADRPKEIYGIRKDSPLIIGLGQTGNWLASDLTAILPYTKQYILLEENEIVQIQENEVKIYSLEREMKEKKVQQMNWSLEEAQKNHFPHFMLKEIFDQPTALKNTLFPRLRKNQIDFRQDGLPENFFLPFKKIFFVACGTAMHAGNIGKFLIESFSRIPTEVDFASEFRYRNPILKQDDLMIFISQSGETADTLAALRLAKSKGICTLAIVNAVNSSIAREADYLLMTHAGPEIAVASTKAFSTQLILLFILALHLAQQKQAMTKDEVSLAVSSLKNSIVDIEGILNRKEEVQQIVQKLDLLHTEHLFFIGRGLDYLVGLEASLKLKEISYIHSEAYAAGELKHGTIALIEEGSIVVAIATDENILAKTISNIKEVVARGAKIFLVIAEGMEVEDSLLEYCFVLPKTEKTLSPFLSTVVFQLFAYYAAMERGCDVDKPKNLAKSVTIE
ncbi:glutamine--fructose-6-phosphate aminotransferase [isomerizing] [Clostridia bacterium]|nr:glutamine--fructose-6-phosphate aminotransferase [isomerizing] [Clostridia bacterium]